MLLYNVKVVKSGDIVEVYEYSNVQSKTLESKKNDNSVSSNSCKSEKVYSDEEILKRSIARTRREIRRKVNANFIKGISRFLTLTFRNHITDLEVANYEFNKFIKRLNYRFFRGKEEKLKYLAVPEFTKKGRVHYHIILFNLHFVPADVLRDIWGNGFIKINLINSIDNVGAYVCKYLSKDLFDERFFGKKKFFCSRNLKESEVYYLLDTQVCFSDSALIFESSFENEFVGLVKYRQYNLTFDNIKDILYLSYGGVNNGL